MSENVIQQLNQLLGQELPPEYLALLADYPASLLSARRSIEETDAEGMVCDVELPNDLDSVLFLNIECRAQSVMDPDGLEWFWPEQFVVVGETGGGDYYCMDVDGDIEGVMQFDHQSVQFEVVADSLQEFVEILEDTFCSPAEDHSH